MATKSQHSRKYRKLPDFLKQMREQAGLTQRELGLKLGQPHSWIYKCEVGNRRVDVTEFVAWAQACEIEPVQALTSLLRLPGTSDK